MIQANRRSFMKGAAAVGALGLAGAPAGRVLAQSAGEIVIGSSSPVTGVFANVGVELNAAMVDYVAWKNAQGGVAGRQLRFVWEDSAYRTDQSVAIFRKLAAAEPLSFYYGDSTGWAKAAAAEISSRGTMMTSSPSFASDLADPEKVPFYFMSAPTYAAQIGVLLQYIKNSQRGPNAPSVALIYSDTEFGRDPIEDAKKRAAALGIPVAVEVVTRPGGVDVSAEVIRIRRARPDFVIFHGYVLAPIPEFIRQIREAGLSPQFMGTIWTMDKLIIDQMGAAAEGFLGVTPYHYYFENVAGAAMDQIRAQTRRARPDAAYRTMYYVHAWLTMMIFEEVAKRVLADGGQLTGQAMGRALRSIRDWDTGGIIGVPVSLETHSIPVGRVYRANAATKLLEPVSDWTTIV